jgi:hypothetical protein
MESQIPKAEVLEAALLRILRAHLNGMHASEMEQAVVSYLNLPLEVLSIKRSDGRKELGYRLAWIRTKAKNKELLIRLDHGVWVLTQNAMELTEPAK